jgi:hypothetical protein
MAARARSTGGIRRARERAMVEVLAVVLAARASGLDADEIVAEVEAVTRGALVVAGPDFVPEDWTP